MRVAFVDLNFSWPPNGGADVDLYGVISGLRREGVEVRLFYAHEIGSAERGLADPRQLPFAATRLEFSRRGLVPARLTPRFKEAVEAWKPEIVFVSHGYALKPHLVPAFRKCRIVSRFYAHELTCARDPLRFKDGAPCPHDYLRSPEVCRACALAHQRSGIRSGRYYTWTADYLAARAYAPEHHAAVMKSLRMSDALIVYNETLKADLAGFHERVHVVPGGVELAEIPLTPAPRRAADQKKTILMVGRADDPLKGLDVLLEAGQMLAERRADFEIAATHFDQSLSRDWFQAIGWYDHAEALGLYARADIAVVPSVWEEPFGLVAVEAMAAGRPVCASRVGGLKETVRHGKTGFLFARGDAADLAKALEVLLDNAELRADMGAAGRKVVEEAYDWKTIIARHYLPLLETLLQ